MSTETQAWAKQQRTGNPVTRAVLNELANWAKPTGCVEWLSLEHIARAVEVSPRTVQRHLDRLEHKLKLIRKIQRYRPDGGRSSNGFDLVGFDPAEWQVRKPSTPHDKVARTPVDTSTPAPRQNVREPHVNCVVGLGDKIEAPTSPSGEVPPVEENQDAERQDSGANAGGGGDAPAPPVPAKPKADPRGTRLPDDWTPPPIADLPPQARHMAGQWPPGAYEAICEQFALHWQSQPGMKGRKLDWLATLGKWIGSDHGRVMRDAKAGVPFQRLAAAGSPYDAGLSEIPARAKRDEDERSRAIHVALERRVTPQNYSRWMARLAIIVEAHGGVTVHVRGAALGRIVEERYGHEIEAAARSILTRAFAGLRFQFEDFNLPAPPKKDQNKP